jgi:hypothetical protein
VADGIIGQTTRMREERELIEEARRSIEETEKLREESGLGEGAEPGPPPKDEPLPEKDDPEPWAKAGGGAADDD